MEYKVLTLLQPWASLLVHGVKKIETRPGSTSWTQEKGIYLIHAAQKWSKIQRDICLQEPFRGELIKLRYLVDFINPDTYEAIWVPMFPKGMIIGAIEVINCHQIRPWRMEPYIGEPYVRKYGNHVEIIKGNEKSFGDYNPGRFAWLCENPRLLKTPIPYKGGQGYYQNFKGDKSQLIFL